MLFFCCFFFCFLLFFMLLTSIQIRIGRHFGSAKRQLAISLRIFATVHLKLLLIKRKDCDSLRVTGTVFNTVCSVLISKTGRMIYRTTSLAHIYKIHLLQFVMFTWSHLYSASKPSNISLLVANLYRRCPGMTKVLLQGLGYFWKLSHSGLQGRRFLLLPSKFLHTKPLLYSYLF